MIKEYIQCVRPEENQKLQELINREKDEIEELNHYGPFDDEYQRVCDAGEKEKLRETAKFQKKYKQGD